MVFVYNISAVLVYAIGAVLASVIAAVFYLAGHIFNNPQYQAQGKYNVYQVIINTIYFVMALVIINIFLFGVLPSMIGGNDPYVYIYSFFTELFFKRIPQALGKVVGSLAAVQLLNGLVSLNVGQGFIRTTIVDFSLINRLITFLVMVISPLLGSIYVQFLVVALINSYAIQVILPVGFVLRMFDLTKKAGNFILAVGISGCTIFILMYVLNAYIVNTMLYSEEFEQTTIASMESALNFVKWYEWLVPFLALVGVMFEKLFILIMRFIFSIVIVLFQGIFMPSFAIVVTTTSINSFMKWFESFG
ncbi:hypothetical protein KO465_00305 [Candidatus Micrarchaeota archaeon]|nr:hypothetical protein [Candidatus Micrarchaeota archaeon]